MLQPYPLSKNHTTFQYAWCRHLKSGLTCAPYGTGEQIHPLYVFASNAVVIYRWDLWTPSKGISTHQHSGPHEEGKPRRPDTMLALIAAGAVIQVDVEQEANFPAPSAFNDTALHLFNTSVFSVLQ